MDPVGASPAFRIREAVPDDAIPIATVHVASWRAAYAGQLPPAVLADLSVDRRAQWWRRALSSSDAGVLVAVDDEDEVIGFVATGPSRDDDATADTGELYAIYLVPGYWGHGVGAALHAKAAESLASAFRRATLWVLRTNDRAIDFYQRHGWSPDGARRVEDVGGWEAVEVRLRCRLD